MKLRIAIKVIRREFEPSGKPARYKPDTIRKALLVAGYDHWPRWIQRGAR